MKINISNSKLNVLRAALLSKVDTPFIDNSKPFVLQKLQEIDMFIPERKDPHPWNVRSKKYF